MKRICKFMSVAFAIALIHASVCSAQLEEGNQESDEPNVGFVDGSYSERDFVDPGGIRAFLQEVKDAAEENAWENFEQAQCEAFLEGLQLVPTIYGVISKNVDNYGGGDVEASATVRINYIILPLNFHGPFLPPERVYYGEAILD